MFQIKTAGSIGSEIGSCAAALLPFGIKMSFFLEEDSYCAKVLSKQYPKIPNIKKIEHLIQKVKEKRISFPDLLCIGDLEEEALISLSSLCSSLLLFEREEEILKNKNHAFSNLLVTLSGNEEAEKEGPFCKAGILHGPKGNLAWRTLDLQYFGLPHQRRRVYLLKGSSSFSPEEVLFKEHKSFSEMPPSFPLAFEKDGSDFEVFLGHVEDLDLAAKENWSSYLSSPYEDSLLLVQDGQFRRWSPVECERLKGLPDDFSYLREESLSERYRAISRAWSVPILQWIAARLLLYDLKKISSENFFLEIDKEVFQTKDGRKIYCGYFSEYPTFQSLSSFVRKEENEELFFPEMQE